MFERADCESVFLASPPVVLLEHRQQHTKALSAPHVRPEVLAPIQDCETQVVLAPKQYSSRAVTALCTAVPERVPDVILPIIAAYFVGERREETTTTTYYVKLPSK